MNSDQQNEVWAMLDRDHLAKVARRGPEPIFATISGAHLYGFASPDSDVDLRGAFMLPAREMLGLRAPDETLTIEDKSSIDLDWVAHDIRKFARLMTNHNKTQRNPARAELERVHGYDTKHAMHLIRLMRMGLEVLETGELRVRRDDADQLSAIRDGALSFDELLSTASSLQRSMEWEATVSRLPADVEHDWVDALLADVLAIT